MLKADCRHFSLSREIHVMYPLERKRLNQLSVRVTLTAIAIAAHRAGRAKFGVFVLKGVVGAPTVWDLWVEGFFAFFATIVVALAFFKVGLTRRNVALRVIDLDAILYFLGGLMGTSGGKLTSRRHR